MKTLYLVAEARTALELQNQVNEMLADGWMLQGGVSVASHFEHWQNQDGAQGESVQVYAQALVMEKSHELPLISFPSFPSVQNESSRTHQIRLRRASHPPGNDRRAEGARRREWHHALHCE